MQCNAPDWLNAIAVNEQTISKLDYQKDDRLIGLVVFSFVFIML
jgi:hypothetical protein